MHCNFPYGVNGTMQTILINPPVEGVIQHISIDRPGNAGGTQEVPHDELFNHLSERDFNVLYPRWYTWGYAQGWSGTYPGEHGVIFHSYYYPPDGINAYYKKIYPDSDKYKLINFYCGAFYGVTHPDNLIYSNFTYKDTRVKFYGSIGISQPSGVGMPSYPWDPDYWTKTVSLLNKINIWVPYPDSGYLLNPSSHMDGLASIYDSDGEAIGSAHYPLFPGVFRAFTSGHYGIGPWCHYKDYMGPSSNGYQIKIKVHLPEGYDTSFFATSPSYVREWDPDIHKYNLVQTAGGDYCKYLFIDGPAAVYPVATPPAEWYDRSFRPFMPIGEFIPVCDIDNTLTIEENMKRYAETIT